MLSDFNFRNFQFHHNPPLARHLCFQSNANTQTHTHVRVLLITAALADHSAIYCNSSEIKEQRCTLSVRQRTRRC